MIAVGSKGWKLNSASYVQAETVSILRKNVCRLSYTCICIHAFAYVYLHTCICIHAFVYMHNLGHQSFVSCSIIIAINYLIASFVGESAPAQCGRSDHVQALYDVH